MGERSRAVRITSLIVVGVGAILLALNILSAGQINVALPLVFLVLGGAFFILVFRFQQTWGWAVYLYIPGAMLIAFGMIFLLNVLTGDWDSWAYAWMLLIAAVGIGMLLVNRTRRLESVAILAGWGMAIIGITFFALFGAIARGPFIQIAAPILLVLGGLSLYWLHRESGLANPGLPPQQRIGEAHHLDAPGVDPLVEELSSRELEVLRLIDTGLSNQEIAEKLSVAPSTVKTHINNIYGKLGVQTRVQAVNRARSLGIFDK